MTTATTRVIQAMFVAHHTGMHQDGKANTLEVFNIPGSEHDEWMHWLKTCHPHMHTKLTANGFVKLGNRKVAESAYKKIGYLDTLAQAYRKDNPESRVGWCLVPTITNSVVFFHGVHRVTPAKRKVDNKDVRTVLYMRILSEAPLEELPDTIADEELCASQHKYREGVVCTLFG